MFGVYADCSMTMSKTLVWIGGDTYNHRAEIKADGFKWSGKKKMWWMPITEYYSKIANVNPETDDYTIWGNANGKPVMIAQVTHGDLTKGDGDCKDLAGRLDYDLGY